MSPQDVARIVSLRLPERQSPTAIAPQSLLRSKGLAGLTAAPGLDPLVMALLRAFSGPSVGGVGPAPTGGTQPPKIHTQAPPGAPTALNTMPPSGGVATPDAPSPEMPGQYDPAFRDWLRRQRQPSGNLTVPTQSQGVLSMPRQDFPIPSPLPGNFPGPRIPQDFPVPEGPITPLF